jgi:nucleoside-diphosphate-sugar epimerase
MAAMSRGALRRGSGQPLRRGSGHRFSKARIKSLGWEAKYSLKEGIARTYVWIEEQVRAAQR